MKRRNITVKFSIPACYRWVATQPWGEIVAFLSKPVVYRAVEDREGDFVPSYWRDKNNILSAELSLVNLDSQSDGAPCKGWRKTLRRLA